MSHAVLIVSGLVRKGPLPTSDGRSSSSRTLKDLRVTTLGSAIRLGATAVVAVACLAIAIPCTRASAVVEGDLRALLKEIQEINRGLTKANADDYQLKLDKLGDRVQNLVNDSNSKLSKADAKKLVRAFDQKQAAVGKLRGALLAAERLAAIVGAWGCSDGTVQAELLVNGSGYANFTVFTPISKSWTRGRLDLDGKAYKIMSDTFVLSESGDSLETAYRLRVGPGKDETLKFTMRPLDGGKAAKKRAAAKAAREAKAAKEHDKKPAKGDAKKKEGAKPKDDVKPNDEGARKPNEKA